MPLSLQCARESCVNLKQHDFGCVDSGGNVYCSQRCNPDIEKLQGVNQRLSLMLLDWGALKPKTLVDAIVIAAQRMEP